jgi:hypothetical protein
MSEDQNQSNPEQDGGEEEDVPITPFGKKLLARQKIKGHSTLVPKKKSADEKEKQKKEEKIRGHDFSIQDILGKEGTVMFNALLASAKKDLGLAQTWVHKAALLKFIISCKILFTTGIIEPHELETFDEPMNAVGNALLELLSAKKAFPKATESERKPILLSTLLKDSLSKWIALVGPHMPADDAHKAEIALQYFFDTKFILAFLNDKDYAEEKTIMKKNAKRLLQPILIPTCKKGKGKCKVSRVLPDGDFTGSSYCAKHHHERYQKLYLAPKFETFIDGATLDFIHFPDHFEKEQKQDPNLLQCYTRLRDFRALPTVAERKDAVKKIWAKYLAEDAEKKFAWPRDTGITRFGSISGPSMASPSHRESVASPAAVAAALSAASLAVPSSPSNGPPELLAPGERPEELKRVKEAIDAGLHGLNSRIFIKLELLLEHYLKRYFDMFAASALYAERLRTYKLPDELLQQLQKEEEARELEEKQRVKRAAISFAEESEVVVIEDSKPLDLGVRLDDRFRKFEELAEAEKRELERHQQMYEQLLQKKHPDNRKISQIDQGSSGEVPSPTIVEVRFSVPLPLSPGEPPSEGEQPDSASVSSPAASPSSAAAAAASAEASSGEPVAPAAAGEVAPEPDVASSASASSTSASASAPSPSASASAPASPPEGAAAEAASS